MDYQGMIQKAIELKRGAHVGCVLTVHHNGTDGSQFVAWYAEQGVGVVAHKLDVANTTQERLNAHWVGFVSNREVAVAAE